MDYGLVAYSNRRTRLPFRAVIIGIVVIAGLALIAFWGCRWVLEILS
jgi:hypothetical protein